MSEITKNKPKHNATYGLFLIILSTIALSTEAVAAKIAYQGGATVNSALVLRYLIAMVMFWGVVIIKGLFYRPSKKEILSILVLGIGGQSMAVLFLFNSFKYIPAAMSILFLYLYPTVVTILAYFFLKEPFTWRKTIALILTFLGCIVILGQPIDNLDHRGVMLALAAAVMNAIFLVGSTRLLSSVPVQVFNTYLVTVVFLFFLLLSLASGSLSLTISPKGWVAIFVLGFVCTVIALSALFHGVEIIGASRAAIASTFEPVITAIWGFWLLQEVLSGWQILGGLLVLTGVLLQQRE